MEANGKSRAHVPWLLLVYEILVLVGWSWMIVIHRYHIYSVYPSNRNWDLAVVLPLCVVVGSMSAASFAIYGMYKHMIHGNFGANYIAWYISKPIVGAVMGGFAGIVFGVIFSTLGANTAASHDALIGVAFLAGSNESFAAQLIETFTKKIFDVKKTPNNIDGESSETTFPG